MPPGKEFHDLRLPTAALSASGLRVEVDDFLSACHYKLPAVKFAIVYTRTGGSARLFLTPFLPDKVGLHRVSFSGRPNFSFQRDALHQEGHIPGQGAHDLQALPVLICFTRLAPVDAVPVFAGGHRHAGDGKKFVDLIESGGETASSGSHHGSSYFHGFIKTSAVKQPGKKG